MKNSYILIALSFIILSACGPANVDTQSEVVDSIPYQVEAIDTLQFKAALIDTIIEDPEPEKAHYVPEPTKAAEPVKKQPVNIEKPIVIADTAKTPIEKETLPVVIEETVVNTVVPLTVGPSGNNIKVSGTSTLHDWTMETSTISGNATIKADNSNMLISIDALSFSLPVISLKSKDEKMDKNARDALDVDKHKTISFKLSSANISPLNNNRYSIKAIGMLTIAGTTKEVTLDAVGLLNENKSMTITGSKSFNMTEFNVKPPQFLLGSMKTGDRVTVEYNLLLIR